MIEGFSTLASALLFSSRRICRDSRVSASSAITARERRTSLTLDPNRTLRFAWPTKYPARALQV